MRGPERSLGGVLQAARGRAGLTQREAAARIGVSANTLARWERGEQTPRGTARERALEVYGLTEAPVTREAMRGLEERVAALERAVRDLREAPRNAIT
jgi:transcriptional regulator with XRE-family HTH domain